VLHALARLAFCAAAGLALWGALGPADGASSLFPWDKAGHFLTFYVVAVLAGPAFPRRSVALLVSALALAGLGIEVLQATPWIARDAEAGDVLADLAGIAAAFAPVVAWKTRERLLLTREQEGTRAPEPARRAGIRAGG
jgi:hypothetical protein